MTKFSGRESSYSEPCIQNARIVIPKGKIKYEPKMLYVIRHVKKNSLM